MPVQQDDFSRILDLYNLLKFENGDRERKIIDLYEKATGNMYDAEDRAELEANKRPITEYPLVEALRNAYVGTERLNRTHMRAVPLKTRNIEKATLMTSALIWNQNRTWYDWRASKRFIHSIVGGVGWSHMFWDFDTGHWEFRPYDALRIRFDRQTQWADLLDCRYLQDTSWLTAEEILNLCQTPEIRKEAKYQFSFYEPKKRGNIFYMKYSEGAWADILQPRIDNDYADFNTGRYRVVDHHERRDVTTVYLIDVTNRKKINVTDYTDEQIDTFISAHPEYTRIDQTKKVLWQTMIVPAIKMVIRDQPYPNPKQIFFSFIPEFGYDIKPEVFDAQSVLENPLKINKSINKRMNVITEYAIKTVNGEYIIEEGAIDGHESEWKTRSNVLYRTYNRNFERPYRESPGQVPATMFNLVGQELSLFDLVHSVSKDFRGFQEYANTTGVLAQSKIKQTEVMMQHIFDNAQLAQYMDAYNCVLDIQRYMTDDQVIALSEGEEVRVNQRTLDGVRNPLNEDIDYEIELDTTKPTATARQYVAQQMAGMMQYTPIDMIRLDKLFESLDVPFAKDMAEFARARYKAMGIDVNNLNASNPASMGMPMAQPGGGQQQRMMAG